MGGARDQPGWVKWLSYVIHVVRSLIGRDCDHVLWRHHMDTFSALLVLCAGNSPVTGEFPLQRLVTRSSDVFLDLRLNTRLSKQSWGWWFETTSRQLWRHCNDDPKQYIEGRPKSASFETKPQHIDNIRRLNGMGTWLFYLILVREI